MAVSSQDIVKGLDPTGSTSISGAEIAAVADNATPASDKGFCILTTDTAGVPDVPDAATTTKWKRYVWIRQLATSVILYVWDDTATSDATYLKWRSVNISSLAANSVTNAMLAGGITSDKVLSVLWSAISGAPTFVQSTDDPNAAGDIAGDFAPGLTIANSKVVTAKIADLNVTQAKIAAAVGTRLVQTVSTEIATSNSFVGEVKAEPGLLNTALLYSEVEPNSILSALNTTITPVTSGNKLFVKGHLNLSLSAGQTDHMVLGVWQYEGAAPGASDEPVFAKWIYAPTSSVGIEVEFSFSVTTSNTNAQKFLIGFAVDTAANVHYNQIAGTVNSNVNGKVISVLEISEYRV